MYADIGPLSFKQQGMPKVSIDDDRVEYSQINCKVCKKGREIVKKINPVGK